MQNNWIKCCFCGRMIKEIDSHNANPLKNGRCCNKCNYQKVIPHRLKLMRKQDEKTNKTQDMKGGNREE